MHLKWNITIILNECIATAVKIHFKIFSLSLLSSSIVYQLKLSLKGGYGYQGLKQADLHLWVPGGWSSTGRKVKVFLNPHLKKYL